MQKKFTVKIPKEVTIMYYQNNGAITFKGPEGNKLINLELELKIKVNVITVTQNFYASVSNKKKKQRKAIQGTTVALLKQLLLEVLSPTYKKLKFVGVGYRAVEIPAFERKLFSLKLGISHSLYIRAPERIDIFCLKYTKLFVYGSSYTHVSQAAAKIRSYKKPEPYKGKGILYHSEKIVLKEGKKI